MKPFYLTTTLPYVNANPHMGHVLEFVQADALARYQRMLGREVIFNTGTDEHGQKIYQKALEAQMDPKAYCDLYAAKFDGLKVAFTLSYTNFIRTTDEKHLAAAQAIWKRCEAKGDIYKKKYKGLYCVGDEMFLKETDLVDGKCPNHPNMDPVEIEEENYFFAFSKYQDALLEYLKKPQVITPEWRRDEAIRFVSSGLDDFSISRSKERLPWGVPVPGDEGQVMYVWFDALTNYISTLDWPNDAPDSTFDRVWTHGDTVQVAGKDQIRFQSLMWQAMLFSAGVKNTDRIFYHGHITSDGQKMSKSLGNVVDPYEIVAQYGTPAIRFFLLGGLPSYEDGDYTNERFEKFYTAHLVNGVGNLASRVLSMLEKYKGGVVPEKVDDPFDVMTIWGRYHTGFDTFAFENVVNAVNELVGVTDRYISEQKPWEKEKAGEPIDAILYATTEALRHIALMILPLMPDQGKELLKKLGLDGKGLGELIAEQQWGGLEPGTTTTKGSVLFPRLEDRNKEIAV